MLGLGSGSTLALVIAELGGRVRDEGLDIIGVPTSWQSRLLAREHGIAIRDMTDIDRLDLAIDGADEVDPAGRLIKGGGAAHVLEKIVAAAADRFFIIVEETKLVQRLGERFRCPVEVVAPAVASIQCQLRARKLDPRLRESAGKLGPVISDNGNPIIDIQIPSEIDVDQLARDLDGTPGVVGHGLFIGMADEILMARNTPQGVAIERRACRRAPPPR